MKYLFRIKQLQVSGIYHFWVEESIRINSGATRYVENYVSKEKEKPNHASQTEFIKLGKTNFEGLYLISKTMVVLSNLVLGSEILAFHFFTRKIEVI